MKMTKMMKSLHNLHQQTWATRLSLRIPVCLVFYKTTSVRYSSFTVPYTLQMGIGIAQRYLVIFTAYTT